MNIDVWFQTSQSFKCVVADLESENSMVRTDGRPLLPEMEGFRDMRISYFMHVKRWKRDKLWPAPSGFHKALVIAIDSKFHRNRKLIARMLGITVEGVKKQVHRAKGDAEMQETALFLKACLPENKHNSLRLLQTASRLPKRY